MAFLKYLNEYCRNFLLILKFENLFINRMTRLNQKIDLFLSMEVIRLFFLKKTITPFDEPHMVCKYVLLFYSAKHFDKRWDAFTQFL